MMKDSSSRQLDLEQLENRVAPIRVVVPMPEPEPPSGGGAPDPKCDQPIAKYSQQKLFNRGQMKKLGSHC